MNDEAVHKGTAAETQDASSDIKPSALPLPRYRLALWLAINGDFRFLSHLDSMSLLRRALVRCGWPLRYSAGFNPRIKMALPMPRSVGMTADEELLAVELTAYLDERRAVRELNKQLPGDIRVHGAHYLEGKINFQPRWADYALTLREDRLRPGQLEDMLKCLQGDGGVLAIDREARGRHKERHFNLRDYVSNLALQGNTLRFRMRQDEAATPRIGEFLELFGIEDPLALAEIRRSKIGYDDALLKGIHDTIRNI